MFKSGGVTCIYSCANSCTLLKHLQGFHRDNRQQINDEDIEKLMKLSKSMHPIHVRLTFDASMRPADEPDDSGSLEKSISNCQGESVPPQEISSSGDQNGHTVNGQNHSGNGQTLAAKEDNVLVNLSSMTDMVIDKVMNDQNYPQVTSVPSVSSDSETQKTCNARYQH